MDICPPILRGVNEATINRDVNPVANTTKPKKESLKLQENISESVADATPPLRIEPHFAEEAKKRMATQRATGKMLGVDQKTISHDIEENSSKSKKESLKSLEKKEQSEENSSTPPPIHIRGF